MSVKVGVDVLDKEWKKMNKTDAFDFGKTYAPLAAGKKLSVYRQPDLAKFEIQKLSVKQSLMNQIYGTEPKPESVTKKQSQAGFKRQKTKVQSPGGYMRFGTIRSPYQTSNISSVGRNPSSFGGSPEQPKAKIQKNVFHY